MTTELWAAEVIEEYVGYDGLSRVLIVRTPDALESGADCIGRTLKLGELPMSVVGVSSGSLRKVAVGDHIVLRAVPL